MGLLALAGLSGVGCSVLIVDGGRGEEPTPQQQAVSGVSGTASGDASGGGSESLLVAAARARAAREAADGETLASDAFLVEVLDRLHAAISDLAGTRWSARAPAVVAAGLRAVAREQARLDAARLALVGDVEGRDDVVPRAQPSTAGAAFLRAALGLDRHHAGREAGTARLITGDQPDLAAVGAAYAAGQISRAHLDIAAGVHRRLGGTAREHPIPVTDESSGEVTEQRTITAVDAVLAARARDFTVAEFARIGDRVVETLNPPSPDGAHQRRYLHLSRLADGSLYGTFFCGPAQALTLTTVIAALAAPRPGKGVDADGVTVDLRDERSGPQRRIDALLDAIDHHPCTHHLTTPTQSGAENTDDGAGAAGEHAGSGADGGGGPDDGDTPGGGLADTDSPRDNNMPPSGDRNDGDPDDTSKSSSSDEAGGETFDDDLAQSQPPPDDLAQSASPREDLAQRGEPPPEGEWEIRRRPGVRAGPYPDIDIIVTASLDQLAHARALAAAESPGQPALGGVAHAQQGGPVHPTTLALLACTARIRRVVLDQHGAVLHLGRGHRLATPAQKAALCARDIGCVIPGCTVPGDLCEIHHVTPWADAGRTDIDNLVLACPRHHIDVTDGTWQLEMIDGVPWARPPAWAHPTRPLLRNASHRPPASAA